MWRENCEVDLDYHVRPYRVDSPGGRRQLDDAVGRIASTPLDRSKPLWEMYFIEGLANGRIAVLGKIHHALADGVASANLLARGMDLQAGPQPERRLVRHRSRARARASWCARQFADHMRQIGRLPGVMRYTAQGIGRVRKSAKKLSPELTRPFTPPPTFMNHRVDAQRKFATATLALADVKETAKHLGVTINDMVLAISAGALRRLSLKYDGQADHPLLASVPVSFDFSPRPHLGQLLHRRDDGGADQLDDPLERVQAVHDAAVDAKETHHLHGARTGQPVVGILPARARRALFHWLADKDGQNKVLNLPISNVPGPREPGRVGGALVTEIYSVGPLTTGSGLNITVWSYVDQLNISVLSDGATLQDPHELTDAMIDAFIEIRRAAGLSEELTVVEKA